MNIVEYIEAMGVDRVSLLADVTRQTVYNWRALKICPQPENAFILIIESRGMLTWESIYQPYFDLNH